MGQKTTSKKIKIDWLKTSQDRYIIFVSLVFLILAIGLFMYCFLENINILDVEPYYVSPIHWLGLSLIFIYAQIFRKIKEVSDAVKRTGNNA